MNAQLSRTAALAQVAARPFAYAPHLASMVEGKAGELIRGQARAAKHFKAVPVNSKGENLTPHMQQFLDHVKANPGQPASQIAAALDISTKSVAMRFFYMRQGGHLPQTEGPLYLQVRPEVQKLRAGGSTQTEIARILGVSATTVARALGKRR